MTALLLALLLHSEGDELASVELALQAAVDRVSPSVVTITTRGGVRRIEAPPTEKMTTPERPRDGDPRAPRKPDEEEERPEGERRTPPRFKNEWEKMLALPGLQKAEGPTTGVIVSAEGHVVTSAWNFESNPNVIVVTLADGSSHSAKLLGVDRAADLALLKVDVEKAAVPEFADPRNVRVGQWAFALGRVLSQPRPEVKYGIVSARNRVEGNALQTDAATSPANYGGPLIDLEGRVLGIIVPLGAQGGEANPNWYDSGIGFAIPVPDPKALVGRLGKEGVVLLPALLGVGLDEERTEPGAKVTDVGAGTPAQAAGLRDGDVIVEAGGEEIRSAFALRFAIGRRRAGDPLPLKVMRDGAALEMTATLAPRRAGEEETKEKLPTAPAPQEDEE
jgi:S1-C subfamily serine protease